jgi:hypothetical protein
MTYLIETGYEKGNCSGKLVRWFAAFASERGPQRQFLQPVDVNLRSHLRRLFLLRQSVLVNNGPPLYRVSVSLDGLP